MSATKWVTTIIIAVVGTTLLIWAASSLDSSKSHRASAKGDNVPTLIVDLPAVKQDDLLICCNEAEYQSAFARLQTFVRIPLGSSFAFPGGPLLITIGDIKLSSDLQAPKRALIEVLKRHSPHRVVLVAHDGCLYYDTIAAWLNDPAHVRQRAYADLDKARTVITTWFPGATVEVWYGERLATQQMRFRPVPEDSLSSARQAFEADTLFHSVP